MEPLAVDKLAGLIADRLTPFSPESGASALVRKLKDKKVVMLGSSTNGTDEFYSTRAR